ncbi:C1 family peptidase [Tumebacillus permanentifrigoris]|uniref:Papain like protease n=1 Tax=Tumebacillus permanentifrigoris TaxID=378543 RepID=A0A316DC42_9BACL|nr:C1 family peptidase [Tumebacillus permanentifrigoris]PWK15564.1 papain like protease [Tumebacillus permanentifrigoris]
MKKQMLAVFASALVMSVSASVAGAAGLHPLGASFTPLGTMVPHEAQSLTGGGTTYGVAPASYDLSSNLPPVGDQGQQGSCVAWSTAYYSKSFGHGFSNPYSSSNEYSPAFVYNQLNGGVDGGLYPSDAYNLLVSKGDTSLAKMPYNQFNYTTQPNSTQLADAALHKNISSTNIFMGAGNGTATARTSVKNALFGTSTDHKLVGIAIPVYPEFDNATATDSYVITAHKAGEKSRGGHMITIVGYDDNKAYTGGVGAFKIVNQWGTGWGNKGFSWISYDMFAKEVQEAWYMNTGN